MAKAPSPKALAQSNQHLRDTARARKSRVRSIASSTAIETREPISKIEGKLNQQRDPRYRVKLA